MKVYGSFVVGCRIAMKTQTLSLPNDPHCRRRRAISVEKFLILKSDFLVESFCSISYVANVLVHGTFVIYVVRAFGYYECDCDVIKMFFALTINVQLQTC